MKQGWTYKSLGDCIDKVPKQKQVKSKDYQSSGKYPIVSQERDLISGYWDDESFLYKHEKPVIIFGDHTKEIKYIDFDFVVGADGTQILSPKSGLNAKFFYYALLATPIRTLGYARHFKLLKEKTFPIPSLAEQEQIVERLDAAFAQIDELKSNAERQLAEARALFQSALTQAMQPKPGWQEKRIKEIADVKGGKRVPKGYKLQSTKTNHPYIRVADFNNYGTIEMSDIQYISDDIFEQIKNYTITDKDLYVSIAGTIGKTGIIPSGLNGANLTENACKLVFKEDINLRFVYLFTLSEIFKKQVEKATKQASQPKLALTRLAEVKISIPSITEQQIIVEHLDALSNHVKELEEISRKTAAECAALKQALLRQIFE